MMDFQVTIEDPFFGSKSDSDAGEEWELLESMTLAVKFPPKNTTNNITRISRTVKFVLRDKKKWSSPLSNSIIGTTVLIR